MLAWVGTNMYVLVCRSLLIGTEAVCRLMILVFTSTAFTNWVKKHVEITEDATFNPYLTFLFFAMYVAFCVHACP